MRLLQMFCQFEMVAGQPPVPRKKPWDKTLAGKDGPDLAAKFLSWYILEGHPGLKVGAWCSSICHQLCRRHQMRQIAPSRQTRTTQATM